MTERVQRTSMTVYPKFEEKYKGIEDEWYVRVFVCECARVNAIIKGRLYNRSEMSSYKPKPSHLCQHASLSLPTIHLMFVTIFADHYLDCEGPSLYIGEL